MKRLIIILFSIFFCFAINAQLSTEEVPYSWGKNSGGTNISSVPKVTLPRLDMDAINREDAENEGVPAPVRFGISHEVNLSLSNSGVWTTTSDGGRLWNLRIYSPDAISLNLLYDKFQLPDGAKFFIYSEDMEQHIGAFTSENNKGDNDNIMGFATGFLYTKSIVLEYFEPEGTKESGIISISQVVSGYRYVYDIVNRANDPDLLTCHNDVTCPAGNGYANERNAVACMVMGNSACTGALLNTTANDNSPVFLSADHCFNATPTTQWVFYWHYEAPCNGNANWDFNRATTGATLLARSANTDFMLLRLNEHPAMNSNITPYFLGWDRANTPASSGAGIHHPRRSPKKISLTNKVENNSGSYLSGTHWKATWNSGATEVGSSGSPLLNQSNRVVGQLHGGVTDCPPKAYDYYGRLDVSWTGGGASSSRLKEHLDPLDTNPSSLDGKNCNITINNQTYGAGTHVLAGCGDVTIYNTVFSSNATVRIHGQNSVILNPGFEAQLGSNVTITVGP